MREAPAWPVALPLEAGAPPLIMGILNATPDSFSDGGRHASLDAALAKGLSLLDEGADILDIGGESTRPGAMPVDVETELSRVIPVIEALHAARPEAILSIDTYKPKTAREAIRAGASIINDIWWLSRDPEMIEVVSSTKASLIVMHNRAEIDPEADILAEMEGFFERALASAQSAGIDLARIVLDPGIGFGKTQQQNLRAIAALPRLARFGCGLLLGVSRKSLLGAITGRAIDARLPATLAIGVAGAMLGADILRVHDVAAHRDAARMLGALCSASVA